MTPDEAEALIRRKPNDDLLRRANRAIGYLRTHGGPSGSVLKEISDTLDEVLRDAAETESALLSLARRSASVDRQIERERAIWDSDPVMKRLDQVRANIAGLRPGDAETIAEFQSASLHMQMDYDRLSKETADISSQVDRLREALRLAEGHLEEMRKDEKWHPIGHCPVLDTVREALSLDPQPTEGGAPRFQPDVPWSDDSEREAFERATEPRADSPPPLQGGEWPEGMKYIQHEREYLLRVISNTPNADLFVASINVLVAMAEAYVRSLSVASVPPPSRVEVLTPITRKKREVFRALSDLPLPPGTDLTATVRRMIEIFATDSPPVSEGVRSSLDWNACDHEWRERIDYDSALEQVVCVKCSCAGERQADGEVFWPAT